MFGFSPLLSDRKLFEVFFFFPFKENLKESDWDLGLAALRWFLEEIYFVKDATFISYLPRLKKSLLVFFNLFRKHKHSCFCIQEVVSGLRQPVSALHSGDGSHRLFILEKEGYVKILTPEGEILKEPYLDIHKLVQSGIKVGFLNFIYLCSGYVNFILVLSSLKVFLRNKGKNVGENKETIEGSNNYGH